MIRGKPVSWDWPPMRGLGKIFFEFVKLQLSKLRVPKSSQRKIIGLKFNQIELVIALAHNDEV